MGTPLRSLAALACFVSLSGPAFAGPTSGYLYGRAAVDVGAFPIGVAAGDLDGDGIADLVVTSSTGDTVTVLLGRSGRAPRALASYPVHAFPTAVALGDLDGDTHLDVAVLATNCDLGVCSPGSVAVFLGNGDGTLSPASLNTTNTNPQDVTIADLDGDGAADLAVANAISTISQGPGTVQIFLGAGDGTFAAGVEYAAGDGVGGVVSGDFDEDGDEDLAVTNAVGFSVTHAVALLRGNGDGTFDAPSAVDTADAPTSLVEGDLDGDGHLDLAVCALGGNAVSVLLGAGDGTFARADYAAGFGPKSIAAADLDGDQDLDLALTTFTALVQGGSLVILRGNGDGTFGLPDEYMTGSIAPSLVAADVNGDAVPDLASTDLDRSAVVYRGTGDGTIERALTVGAGSGPAAVVTGRFDAGSTLDLAVANSLGSSVTVTLGNGDGTFGSPVEIATGRSPLAIVSADFDRDGSADLATADFEDGTVSFLRGRGDGTFDPAVAFPCGLGPVALVAADFDGNGSPDLAVASQSKGKVEVLLGNGDGTFGAPIDRAAGPFPSSLAVGDFDLDGNLDLAVAAGALGSFGPGVVDVLLGNGDGTFRAPARFRAGIEADAIATADLDADGLLDLVVGTNLDIHGSVTVLLGKGGGDFRNGGSYSTGALTVAVLAADLTGDSRPDIAAVNVFSQTLTVLAGRGNGTFVAHATQDPGPIPVGIAAGDFDGDGLADLVIADQLDSTVAVLRSAGGDVFRTADSGTASTTRFR
jgi:hypothetical protein